MYGIRTTLKGIGKEHTHENDRITIQTNQDELKIADVKALFL